MVLLGVVLAGPIPSGRIPDRWGLWIVLLAWWDKPLHAAAIVLILGGQLAAMRVMLRDPEGKTPWYQGVGILLYITGMMIGAIVVLTTSTFNRLMVVEFALPAALPGALVGLHYGIQLTHPRWGFISDKGGSRTTWTIDGMAALAICGMLAARQ